MFSIVFLLLGMIVGSPSWAAPARAVPTQAVPAFCELAALPSLPLASDSTEHFTPEELLDRVALSYRGLLEFAGDEFGEERLASLSANSADAELTLQRQSRQLEKYFEPVAVAEQRSVALNESLTRLGDWVLLDAEEHGLTQAVILTRLREVVRTYVEHVSQERERVEETREERRHPGIETSTGAIFYRDTSHPNLGEAFRDPDGMIWGDVVRKPGGFNRNMDHAEALKYCQSIGAELPTREDFIRLRDYMGAKPGALGDYNSVIGYSPQILPNLKDGYFTSSSVDPSDSKNAYLFYGEYGGLLKQRRVNLYSVRCVARTERL